MSNQNIDNKLVNKIINAAYGDATIFEKLIVFIKSLFNADAKNLLNEYRATANKVHTFKSEEVPERVIENVKIKTESIKETESIFQKIYFTFISKPILSVSGAAITVLIIISLFVIKQPSPSHNYSKAEIELAQKQFEESIAIVNKVFKKAERTIDEEVIPKHVGKPLNKGLKLLNDYLIGG